MNKKIDTIVFDLGGVLVDWNPEYVYRSVFKGNEEKMDWFLTNVCSPEWNIEQDGGRTIAEGEAILIAEYPNYEKEIRLFYAEWEHMFSGPIQKNVELFKQLKTSGNYKIYALTNWSAEKWGKALELFPFFNDFDGVIVSGQEKCRKPFPEIYNKLINRFSISPEKAIFIDDNKDNIIAAQSLNMNGIHYKKHSQFTEELSAFQLIF